MHILKVLLEYMQMREKFKKKNMPPSFLSTSFQTVFQPVHKYKCTGTAHKMSLNLKDHTCQINPIDTVWCPQYHLPHQ